MDRIDKRLSRLTIRPAKPEDMEETVRIYMECVQSDYASKSEAFLTTRSVEDELAECKQWMYESGNPNQIFVAMSGKVMAGYVAVGPAIGGPVEHAGELCGFFVRSAYRHQGIGLRLLQSGIEYLSGLGFLKMVAYNYKVTDSNQYYRSLGGKVIHREIQHPGGKPLEVEVFCFDIDRLTSTLKKICIEKES